MINDPIINPPFPYAAGDYPNPLPPINQHQVYTVDNTLPLPPNFVTIDRIQPLLVPKSAPEFVDPPQTPDALVLSAEKLMEGILDEHLDTMLALSITNLVKGLVKTTYCMGFIDGKRGYTPGEGA